MDEKICGFLNSKVASRLLHLALVAGASYLAVNPKYAWAIPVLQAIGQASEPPK